VRKQREPLYHDIKEMLVPLLNSNDREFISLHFTSEFFQKHVKIQALQFKTINAKAILNCC
jgi:hypothetical protein